MSLWQYKDATRAELWEILQIQLEETQRLTADLDDLQTYFDSCYEELQAARVAHDKIKQERDELLNNQAKRIAELEKLGNEMAIIISDLRAHIKIRGVV